ncbi:MAG: hypothetical protein ACRCZY_03445 [Phocaeicola sp.]
MFKSTKSTLLVLSGVLAMSSCSKENVEDGAKEPLKMTITVNLQTEGKGGSVPTTASALRDQYIQCTPSIESNFDGVTWYGDSAKVIMETDSLKDIYVKGTSLYIKASDSVDGKSYTARFGKGAPRIMVTGLANDAKFGITRNPEDCGVFFQFGSVIAWKGAGYDPTVVFNPSALSVSTWNEAWSVGDSYPLQSLEMIENGKGDPCRLVGLTLEDIKSENVDSKEWKTPTKTDNDSLYSKHSNMTVMNGIVGRFFGEGATETGTGGEFLPAIGIRFGSSGKLTGQGSLGYYCTSSLKNSTDAFHLSFADKFVKPTTTGSHAFGRPVRCIPQQ